MNDEIALERHHIVEIGLWTFLVIQSCIVAFSWSSSADFDYGWSVVFMLLHAVKMLLTLVALVYMVRANRYTREQRSQDVIKTFIDQMEKYSCNTLIVLHGFSLHTAWLLLFSLMFSWAYVRTHLGLSLLIHGITTATWHVYDCLLNVECCWLFHTLGSVFQWLFHTLRSVFQCMCPPNPISRMTTSVNAFSTENSSEPQQAATVQNASVSTESAAAPSGVRVERV